jgi:hypothetical protein
MTPKILRVRARGPNEFESGPPMVQNYEKLEAGINSFVGLKFGEIEGQPGQFGFAVIDDIVELPYRGEYVKALKDGSLLPADEETATAAGLTNSNFNSAMEE